MTFTIEPLDGMVRLTVMQHGFEPGGWAIELISHGWPQYLPGLKALLESE